MKVAWADQGYTGQDAKSDAKAAGIELRVVKLPEAKKGLVLLPRRWVVERSLTTRSSMPAALASLLASWPV